MRSDRAASAPREQTPAVVDRQLYRDAMARLAAAVNIITSVGQSGPCGFTASAVCSVTDDPPTLLVCVNRATQSHPIIAASRVLCVNTIGSRHEALASSFAGGIKDMARRFEGAAWSTAVTGSPILDEAAATFDCRIVDFATFGTHDVFYCEVLAVGRSAASGGLVYHDRRFHRIA